MLLDESTQKQLREKYNPDGSKLRELQMSMKQILDVVDDICVRNDIPYWLSSGTLIGAVRHGGFIPWDDDVDIDMLYSDIPRFIKACGKDLPDGFVVQTHKTDRSYYLNIVKLRKLGTEVAEIARFKDGTSFPVEYKYMGHFIDILPIEPSKLSLVRFSGKFMAFMTKARFFWHFPKFLLEMTYWMVQLVYAVLRLISRVVSDRHECYVTYGSWFIRHRDLDDIFPLKRMEFEGTMYNVPNDTHAYLSKIYKDYTKLPDDALRVSMHDTNLTK